MSRKTENLTSFNYQRGGVTLALMPMNQNKAVDGTIPSCWRITFKGKRKYYKTGLSFTENDWEDFCNKNRLKHKDIKLDLKKYYDNILCKAIDDLVTDNSFSLEVLDNVLKMGDKNSVNDAFNNKITNLRKDNKIGNAEMYESSFNALLRFKHYISLRSKSKDDFLSKCIEYRNVTRGDNKITIPGKNINFSELTPQFLKDCDKFWRQTGVSSSTVSMRMRSIRAIINNDGSPYLEGKNYPFGKGKYLIPSSTRRQGFLPIEDIWRIEGFETDNAELELAKDIFLFMFYGSGMNFKDLCLLKYSDITFDKELKFTRAKTDIDTNDDPQYIFVPILPPMLEIINKYGNKFQSGYIFPFLNGVSSYEEAEIKKRNRRDLDPINVNIKIIAEQLELNPEITTNWARHSYISHLVNELLLNDITVKYMVGHSIKRDVTAGYAHSTPKKRKEINMQLLNPDKINII
jgi:integrase